MNDINQFNFRWITELTYSYQCSYHIRELRHHVGSRQRRRYIFIIIIENLLFGFHRSASSGTYSGVLK